ICLKCLHKQPTRRYASAEELAGDLDRYLRGEPIQARPVGALERSWRWCKRQPAVAGLTLALLLTLTGAVTLLAVLWFRAVGHADRAETLFHESEQRRVALAAANNSIEEKREEAEKGRLELKKVNEDLEKASKRIEEKRMEAEQGRLELKKANEDLQQASKRIEEKRMEAERAQADADASSRLAHKLFIDL